MPNCVSQNIVFKNGGLDIDTGEEVVSLIKYNKVIRENQELKRLIGELTLDLSLGKKNWASGSCRY